MIQDLIPRKWRKIIYAVLGALVAVNGVLNVLPGMVLGKIVSVAGVLGFGLAVGNTGGPPPTGPAPTGGAS